MSRIASVVTLVVVCLGLAGCGNQTVTAKFGAAGISVSMVISGNSDAINAAKKQVQTQGAQSGLTFTDGDSHDGSKICETDATDPASKQSYHVVMYSTSSAMPASICDSIKSAN